MPVTFIRRLRDASADQDYSQQLKDQARLQGHIEQKLAHTHSAADEKDHPQTPGEALEQAKLDSRNAVHVLW